MNIVLIGKPGSGKSTISNRIISSNFNYKIIVAGDLLRKERNSGTLLGNRIKTIIDKGNLVPDKMITDIIEKEIEKSSDSNIMIDGYPRTIMQAISLEDMLKVDMVIYFDVSDSTILKRIEDRSKISGREDDDIEIAKDRLDNYYKNTHPAVEYFKLNNKLKVVDASRSIDDVFNDVKKIMKGE